MSARWTEEQLAAYRERIAKAPPLSFNVDNSHCTISVVEDPDPDPESNLQEKIEKYCREHGFPFFHDRSRKKNAPGFPDLVIALKGGRTLWLELKSKGGVMSKEQKEWRLQLLALGHEHHIVKSYRGFMQIIG